jgi:SAM-dependent methyltransferase
LPIGLHRGRRVGVAERARRRRHASSPFSHPGRGCGNAVPVTEALVNAGYRVVGLDSSAAMLARFQANLPGTSVVPGDARLCPFVNGGFDAAISMGMMFHLTRGEQAAVFARVSRVLKPGAPFLFTGAEIEEADDAVSQGR